MTRKRLARKAIKDWPEAERPREKLIGSGAETLTDGELLAILLRIGSAGQSAEGWGRELLTQFEGLNGIDRAHIEDLRSEQARPISFDTGYASFFDAPFKKNSFAVVGARHLP